MYILLVYVLYGMYCFLVECEDVFIVLLVLDRLDNGYFVFFKINFLIYFLKDDLVFFVFLNVMNIKELFYDFLERILYMIDILFNLFRMENIFYSIKFDEFISNVIDMFFFLFLKIVIDWVLKNFYYIDLLF